MKMARIFAVLFAVALLAGCSSTTTTKSKNPRVIGAKSDMESSQIKAFAAYLKPLFPASMPGLAAGEHGDVSLFELTPQMQRMWLEPEMRKDLVNIDFGFAAAVEREHKPELRYLYSREKNTFRLLSAYRFDDGKWRKFYPAAK